MASSAVWDVTNIDETMESETKKFSFQPVKGAEYFVLHVSMTRQVI